MPSLQARLAYFLAKHIWSKKTIRREDLPLSRKHSQHSGKLFLSSQPVKRSSQVINGITIDTIEPENKSNKIILYIHGGGFVLGVTHFHYELMNRLAIAAKVKVFAIHYSLAPEHPFPTQINEVEKIYLWLLKQGYKPQNIFFAGESAGGNIALATALSLRDEKKSLPAGIIAISASTDGTFSYKSFVSNKDTDIILTSQKMHFFLDAYRGKESKTNPLISPIFANLKGLPKLQLFVSDNELLFDDNINFCEKLKHVGVPYELHIGQGLAHGYPLAAKFVPEARESIRQMAKFINHN